MAVAEEPSKLIPNLPPLTQRQTELLQYIWSYWVENRYTPTQREMCQRLGIASNNAGSHLNPLERKGYIGRGQGKRNIHITRDGAQKLMMMGLADDSQMELFREEN